MKRWSDRSRQNVALDEGPSVFWLIQRLLLCVWMLAAAYGVTVLLMAS